MLDPANPFLVTERRGKLLFHKFRASLQMGSLANFKQSKLAKERTFFFVNRKEQTLNLMKIPTMFDPRAAPECAEGYLIKQ